MIPRYRAPNKEGYYYQDKSFLNEEDYMDEYYYDYDDEDIKVKISQIKSEEPMKMCNSGGAHGSDTVWHDECVKRGIPVRAFHFVKKLEGKPNFVILDQASLDLADPYCIQANQKLKRYFPANGKPWIANLLRRNYYQIRDSEAVYAIGKIDFDKGIVHGGTGWAVQMAIDKELFVYVFDLNKNNWFAWSYVDNKFIDIDKPGFHNTFAGIGTREITEAGIKAIQNFLDEYVQM